MKIELREIPWFTLGVLGLVYLLLGWYLSAHHIVWLLGAIITLVTLVAVWKGLPLLNQWSWFTSQNLFAVTIIGLAMSLGMMLFVTDFQFLGLIVLPILAMFLAALEMRSIGFEQHQVMLILFVIAGLAIGLGEVIDLKLIPSMRY